MAASDWVEWHEAYEDPDTPLSRRLTLVQARITEFLDQAPPGPLRAVSLCAGQGRDLIGVLARHPRGADVTARLIELEPRLAAQAARFAADAGLERVEVKNADASDTTACLGAVPAELVLLCGIFGNISDDDIHNTVGWVPSLCAPGATVLWTRGRREPDITPTVRGWFAETGFDEVGFDRVPNGLQSVGTNRLNRPPDAVVPGVRLFRFLK